MFIIGSRVLKLNYSSRKIFAANTECSVKA
jgi:hypothetical protein